MIDPSFWLDKDVRRLSAHEKLLFVAHFSLADDEGRGAADVEDFKSNAFSKDDDVDEEAIERMMERLSVPKRGKPVPLVVYYTVEGSLYYWIPRFARHQSISRPTKSRLPAPPDDYVDLRMPTRSDEYRAAKGLADGIIKYAMAGKWSHVEKTLRVIPGGVTYNRTAEILRDRLSLDGRRIRSVEEWVEAIREQVRALEARDGKAKAPKARGDVAAVGLPDAAVDAPPRGAPDDHAAGDSGDLWDLRSEAPGG